MAYPKTTTKKMTQKYSENSLKDLKISNKKIFT